MAQRLNLSVDLGKRPSGGAGSNADSQRLKFILLGCFSGSRGTQPGIHRVDLDNFDRLLSQIQPTLQIQMSDQGAPVHLNFTSLDDFHPDHLHHQLPKQLAASIEPDATTPQADTATDGHQESDQQTLSRLLGKGSMTASSINDGGSKANRTLVESVVGRLIDSSLKQQESDYSVPQSDASAAQSRRLKQVIHHADFQSLESNWRGLDWLVRSLESDQLNEIFICDLPQDAWPGFAQSELEFKQSDCYRSLLDRFSDTGSSEQKFILIVDKYFNSSTEDMNLLKSLSALAETLRSQLITGTSDQFTSRFETDPETLNKWRLLQQSDIATNTSLVLPRLLMRLPYGARYDPVESFPFEELDSEWSSEELLWGNPAFALAIQLAADNQSDQPQDAAALADCPAFAYSKNGESHLQPCTKSLFNDKQLENLIELGLIPIVGSRRSPQIRIPWYRKV
ncbi:MAG: type VI secretion system contractile sheath large subunit [Candidatus Thiodiazotropha sp.]